MVETVKTLRNDYTSRLSILEIREVVNWVLLPFLSNPDKYHPRFFKLLSTAEAKYLNDVVSTGTKIRAKSIIQRRCFITFFAMYGELHFRFENPTRYGRKSHTACVKETIRGVPSFTTYLSFSEILAIAKKTNSVLFLPDGSLSNLEAFCLKNI